MFRRMWRGWKGSDLEWCFFFQKLAPFFRGFHDVVEGGGKFKLLETEGYVLLFPPPTEVFIYVSTIYLQSSGVIYNIKYY